MTKDCVGGETPSQKPSAPDLVNQDAIRQFVIDSLKKGGITITIPIDKIKHVVDEQALAKLKEFDAVASSILEEAKKLTSCTQKIEIKEGASIKTKGGLYHADFSKVFSLVTARNPFNRFPVGLWLWSGAGAGKTHLAEQIAEALKVPFLPIYGGPTMTETKLLGYRNAGTGAYVKGLTYDWYKNGGLLAIDEADLGESLSCMNSLFANSVYRFPDGEVIPRHPDTYFIALANTNGMGAKSGFRRSVQDVAALDRFNFWEFNYDWKLTKALCGEWPEFCDYVEQVHKWVKQQAKETNLHVTPRAAMRGASLLHATDFDGRHVSEASVFCLFPKDTKDACVKSLGYFDRNTRKPAVEAKPPIAEAVGKKRPIMKTSDLEELAKNYGKWAEPNKGVEWIGASSNLAQYIKDQELKIQAAKIDSIKQSPF